MLDSFHMNIEEQSMTEPILRVGRNLGHFHLCESSGACLGSGNLDIGSIVRALDSIAYDGYVSVKAYRDAWEPAAGDSMHYLRSLRLVVES
jgi:D-psicose/D-tagatose/L-ribulose 3-epimerase